MIYNVVLVSGVQQSDSDIVIHLYTHIYTHTHIYILFQILFPYRLLKILSIVLCATQ